MPGQFVWINGMPGVGKLTVARALHALLPESRLVDNHSLIDQVTLPRSHPSYDAERARVRDAVYASVVRPRSDEASACGDQAAQLAQVVIFTGAYSPIFVHATPRPLTDRQKTSSPRAPSARRGRRRIAPPPPRPDARFCPSI